MRFGTSRTAAIGHGQRKAPRAEEVAAPDEERRDQQDEDDGKRVLRLESDADGKPEQGPGAAAECEPQREPENDHRRQLVERDRLEEQIGREHRRPEPDHHGCKRLRTARRPELAGHKGTDQHRPRARKNRESAQADQRPAEQLSGQRREQRRRRRELDVAALKMQPGDGVVQLIAMPAVPSGHREFQRALQRDNDEDRPRREDDRALLCAPLRHGPSLEPGSHTTPPS